MNWQLLLKGYYHQWIISLLAHNWSAFADHEKAAVRELTK